MCARNSMYIEHMCTSLGLSFPVFKGVMKKGYKLPTPIQRKASTIFRLHFKSLNYYNIYIVTL